MAKKSNRKQHKLSKKIWLLIISAGSMVIALPIGIDWLIIGNDFPSNISNAEWVGFLGEYIGAIVGGIVSLIGIIVTIRFTKAQIEANQAQYEDQKRMNYIPILDCKICEIFTGLDSDAISMEVEYALDKIEQLYPLTIAFDICNIGVGAASDLTYGMKINGIRQDGVFWLPHKRVIRAQDSFEQKITLYIPDNETFTPTIVIFYEDVIGNGYCKSIDLVIRHTKEHEQLDCFVKAQDKGTLCQDLSALKQYYVVKTLECKEHTLE